MMLADTVFIAIALMTLTGAFLAVWLKNVFYNALSLILCLFGVACLFIYLNSEFLAVMEVIIYIGAISIAIIFAIMLSQTMYQKDQKRDTKKILRSTLIAGLFFIGLVKTMSATQWPTVNVEGNYSIDSVGKTLVGPAALPFEVVSLVLLIAIVGALLISSSKDTAQQ